MNSPDRRDRLPAAQVFARVKQSGPAPWERGPRAFHRPQPVFPGPPSPDGQPAPDNTATTLMPRFTDEDFDREEQRLREQGLTDQGRREERGGVEGGRLEGGVPGGVVRKETAEQANRSLLASTGSIAFATLMSRITGFVKQVLVLVLLGSAIAGSFTVATQLPNLISELVLGAVLSAIVVPVLVRAEREDADYGAAFVRRLFTVAAVLLILIAVGATLAAPLLTDLMLPSDTKVNAPLTRALSYLLLPAILFYGLSALLTAILNTRQNFKPGAWAPVLNNVVVLVIFGVYFAVPGEISLDPVRMGDPKLLILGLGVTAGVVMQVAALIPAIRRERIDLRPLWGLDQRLKQFAGMAAAIVLYVLISQAGLVFTTNISAGADKAGPAIYSQAWILLQLPYGVIGVTVLTAIMPRLSRNAAALDTPAVIDDLSVATRLTMVTLVPIIGFLTFGGSIVVEALYGYGRFAADAPVLGQAVSWSAFSLVPYALVLIHLRVFYAREQAWTPTWIILGITSVKVGLTALASTFASSSQQVVVLLGVANGLGFATGAVIGAFLLKRSLGNLRMANVGRTMFIVVAASLVGGVAMLAVDRVLHLEELRMSFGIIGALIRVAIDAVLMLSITFVILWFANVPEVLALTVTLSRVLTKITGKITGKVRPGSGSADPIPDATSAVTTPTPVVSAGTTWDTRRGDLPYPGPRQVPRASDRGMDSGRPGGRSSAAGTSPVAGRSAGVGGGYSRSETERGEGVRVADDKVAGGPTGSIDSAGSTDGDVDRTPGGVSTDTAQRAAHNPSDAFSGDDTAPTPEAASAQDTADDRAESESDDSTTAKTTQFAQVSAEDSASADTTAMASAAPANTESVDEKTTQADAVDAVTSAAPTADLPAGIAPTAPVTMAATPAATPSGTNAAPDTGPADGRRSVRGPKLIPGASVAGGRYRLLAPQGGARGLEFWQAHDVKLDREVALTFVDANQSSAGAPADVPEGPQAVLSRTLRLGRINSPGLARVLDVVRGSSGGIVVAEWTPGRSLREMADTVPSPTGAASAIKALAGAAEAAHRTGGALSLDHPDRIRISTSGNAVLAFPATLADADPAADVRGLGAMLYALITARWPLSEAETTGPGSAASGAAGSPIRSVGGMKLADRDANGMPMEPRKIRPDVPFEISAVAVRALEQNGGIRTAATVQHVLDQAAVINDKTDLMPALRLGQRAQGATGHSLADPEEMAAEKKRSNRTYGALIGLGILVVIVLGFAGYWLFNSLAGDSTEAPIGGGLGLTTSAAAPAVAGTTDGADGATAAPAAAPVTVSSVSVFSPQGSADNADTADNATDNNPATEWTTDSYFQPFPALKNGIGLLATLPDARALTNATITSPSPGTVVEIRSAPSDSASLSDTTVIGQATLGAGVTQIPLNAAEPTSYVLVWITDLSNQDGRNQSAITDVSFTAAS